jgi:hypothetical protein
VDDNQLDIEGNVPVSGLPSWVWVDSGKYGFFRRENEEEEALRVLAEADMLLKVKVEEVPA